MGPGTVQGGPNPASNYNPGGQAIMMSSSQFSTLLDKLKPSETPTTKVLAVNHPPLIRLQKEVRAKVDGRVVFNVTCLSPPHQKKLEQYSMRDDSHKTALGDGSFITRGVDLQPAMALSVDYDAVRHGLDAYIGLHGTSEFPAIRERVVDLQAWATKVWTYQSDNKRACRYINAFMQKYATQDNWSGLFDSDMQLMMKYFYAQVDSFEGKTADTTLSTSTVANVQNRQPSQPGGPAAKKRKPNTAEGGGRWNYSGKGKLPKICFSRLDKSKTCAFDPKCRFDHACPCCPGETHPASNCKKWVQATADAAAASR